MQGKKGYQEKLFTNFQLSQRVPEANFYRRLKSLGEEHPNTQTFLKNYQIFLNEKNESKFL